MGDVKLINHLLQNPKKLNIYKEYSKFQINNCFTNLAHEPIVSAHYFDRFT